MTPSRARRLAGWASLAAIVGYWLSVCVEDELDLLENELELLRARNAGLELFFASLPDPVPSPPSEDDD